MIGGRSGRKRAKKKGITTMRKKFIGHVCTCKVTTIGSQIFL
jgi:hypothetical protein